MSAAAGAMLRRRRSVRLGRRWLAAGRPIHEIYERREASEEWVAGEEHRRTAAAEHLGWGKLRSRLVLGCQDFPVEMNR